jgi:Tol biopolymer transport system component
MIGRVISHYRIQERLAGGSMGVVYKAEDIGLQRTVALKFLSPELTRDAKARKRFTREARAASALDHPNICTIHEIDVTADGQTFIAMAFYEGDTLKQRMRLGQIPGQELAEIVTQMASGLGKAHERGIVHRDVKPANVLLTLEGQVKLLDFGLAKQISGSNDYLTQSGFAMGTPTYMSPEQALGETVDSRSDQWSLATIVYEALAGKPPFRGPSKMAVLFAIINRAAEPVTMERPDLPPEIDHVFSRALAKNSNDRYATIVGFAEDLREVLAAAEEFEPEPEPAAQEAAAEVVLAVDERTTDLPFLQHLAPLRWLYAAVALAALVVVALVAFLATRSSPPPRIQSVTQLTQAPGMEQYPSFSPDARMVAYVSEERGQKDIWIRNLDDDRTFPLTTAAEHDVYPVFSPDGRHLAFVSGHAGGGIFVIDMPPTAGTLPRQVAPFAFDASQAELAWTPTLAWTPDSRCLIFSGTSRAPGLFAIFLEGGEPTAPLSLPPELDSKRLTQPSFSPNAETLAFTALSGTGISVSTIWLMKSDGSEAVAISDGQNFDHQSIFSPDGKQLLFLSDRAGITDIWTQPLDWRGRPKGEPGPVTVGIGIDSFAIAPGGTRIVYSKVTEQANIYTLPLTADKAAVFDEARALTSGSHKVEHLDVSADGNWIVFDSNRAGNMDVWIMRRDGSSLRQLTTNPAFDWRPVFSPDATEIVFYSMRSGNRDLYLMAIEGESSAAPLQLTHDPGMDWMPSFSADGSQIVFGSSRAGSHDIWMLPTSGGEPRQLTSGEPQDRFAVLSPDGTQLAFERGQGDHAGIFLLNLEGGEPVALTAQDWWRLAPFAWSDDGATIYAHARRITELPRLVAISVSSGEVRSLTNFKSSAQVYQSLAVHDSTLLFPLLQRQGDLWLGELGK